MKIILLQNIKGLGNISDTKDVADGYARNFLFPKKLAIVATPEAIKKTNAEKEGRIEENKKELEKIQKLAREISSKEIIIKMKEKKGKLFGSVGKNEIAKKMGSGIVEDMIELKENIKETGKREIVVNFGNNIRTRITINVLGE